MSYSDAHLKQILARTRVIAVVGLSANPIRPSYFVARYLKLKGFRVIPVNPGLAGQQLFGETVCASLAEIPSAIPVDMVDIFRRSEAVPAIVDDALAHLPALKTIWMQIGVEHEGAAETARARGIDVIMNRCPKIEYQRLHDELRMAGFNTGIISSKLRPSARGQGAHLSIYEKKEQAPPLSFHKYSGGLGAAPPVAPQARHCKPIAAGAPPQNHRRRRATAIPSPKARTERSEARPNAVRRVSAKRGRERYLAAFSAMPEVPWRRSSSASTSASATSRAASMTSR